MRPLIAVLALSLPHVGLAQEKTKAGPAKPEAAKAEPAKPEAAKPEAAKPEKMVPPKPGPEMEALKPIAGMWSCDGKAPEGPMGPAHSFKATMNHKLDLGNFWIWSEYQEKKAKDNPMGFTGRGWMGWDSANKRYVWAGVDDMGGWISLTSTGWQGDKMEWEGDGMGMMGKHRLKFTITKGKSASEISMEMTGQNPKGEWMPPATETCKKK